MSTKRATTITVSSILQSPNPNKIIICPFSLWTMTKDPSLEKALTRNRRWIVNNQIKNHLIHSPDQISTVHSLQKKFKSFDLQGKALNWLQKYPSCFQTFTNPNNVNELLFTFSKKMSHVVQEEEYVKNLSEPLMVNRLAKLLMLSSNHRLNVVKLNELKKSFGLCEDYLLRIVAKHDDMFRMVNLVGRNSMEIELVKWDEELAVSIIERSAVEGVPKFSCSLPDTWIKTGEKFEEFNGRSEYISPYDRERCGGDVEKRVVGIVHELLSLTLWKKASILKLEKFRREFGLPERLNCLLLRHPCIFYVSNRYNIYTVVLREGYSGPELVEKDPMVVLKEKFGELMQEGLHEYNRRKCVANLEKKRKSGEVAVRVKREKEDEDEVVKEEKTEERKRFYRVLFDENP